MKSIKENLLVRYKLSNGLNALVVTPKRAVLLLPLVLAASYATGFGAVALTVGQQSGSGKSMIVINSVAIEHKLLSLVPLAYAAAYLPKNCSGSCPVLEPESYTNSPTSDFYTPSTGVDFMLVRPGEPNVGYINVNSPQKSITKRFD